MNAIFYGLGFLFLLLTAATGATLFSRGEMSVFHELLVVAMVGVTLLVFGFAGVMTRLDKMAPVTPPPIPPEQPTVEM